MPRLSGISWTICLKLPAICARSLGPNRSDETRAVVATTARTRIADKRRRSCGLELFAEPAVDRIAPAAAEEDRQEQQPPQQRVFDSLVGPEIAEVPLEPDD